MSRLTKSENDLRLSEESSSEKSYLADVSQDSSDQIVVRQHLDTCELVTSRLERKEAASRFQVCSVPGCLNNTFYDDSSFFSLPDNKTKRKKWLRLINREDLLDKPMAHARLCADHFELASILVSPDGWILETKGCLQIKLPDWGRNRCKILDSNFVFINSISVVEKETQTRPTDKMVLYVEMTGEHSERCPFCGKKKKSPVEEIIWSEFEPFSNYCNRLLGKNFHSANPETRPSFATFFVFNLFGLFFNVRIHKFY